MKITGAREELYELRRQIESNDGRLTSDSSADLDYAFELQHEWFVVHDAEVKATALEEASDWLESFLSGVISETGQTLAGRDIIARLRARAAEIRKEGQ